MIMKTRILGIIVTILLVIVLSPTDLKAQTDQGLIYGKVYTVGGDVFEGQIRWGKEESCWGDIFYSSKGEIPYKSYFLSEVKKDKSS